MLIENGPRFAGSLDSSVIVGSAVEFYASNQATTTVIHPYSKENSVIKVNTAQVESEIILPEDTLIKYVTIWSNYTYQYVRVGPVIGWPEYFDGEKNVFLAKGEEKTISAIVFFKVKH